MSDHDRNRLKRICAELKEARGALTTARKSAKDATTLVAKEEAAREIKEVKDDLARLQGEQAALIDKVSVA